MERRALKELAALDHDLHARVVQALEVLERRGPVPDPGLDIRPLEGRAGLWRLRVGRYRAVFEVRGDLVVVTRIAHRAVAYRL